MSAVSSSVCCPTPRRTPWAFTGASKASTPHTPGCSNSTPRRAPRSRTWATASARVTCWILSAMYSESSKIPTSTSTKSNESHVRRRFGGVKSGARAPDNICPGGAYMRRATGSFEVNLQPLVNDDVTADARFGRLLLTKKFTGDLAASARGQMLSAGTPVKGSASYVAIDLVTGELDGRKGSFA